MSLLMQALKKAERAKLNSAQEGELEKPSEAYDEVLSLLAPEPEAPKESRFTLEMEPLSGVTLAPLSTEPAQTFRPSSGAAPAVPSAPAGQRGAAGPQLEPLLEPLHHSLPPIPVLTVAAEAIHDPVPPQAKRVDSSHEQDGLDPEMPAPSRPAAAPAAPPPFAKPAAAAKGARAASGTSITMDPARIRVIALSVAALAVASVLGYMYYQAVYGVGAGAQLPMVPMPPPGATASTSGTLVVPLKDGGSGDSAVNDNYTPAPPPPASEAGQAGGAPAPIRDPEADISGQAIVAHMAKMRELNSTPPPPALPAALAAAAAPASDLGANDIKVVRKLLTPQLSPPLQGGYQALNSGDLGDADKFYEQALRQDPNNRDALLGKAALAVRQRQLQQADNTYLRLLELDPNDVDAAAGLIGLRQGDAAQSELRLKALLQRSPESASALFTLGNLYARQGRWSEAQPLYFRAFSNSPDNADYAFNLAIGLDRLNQGKLAIGYYQRALALSQDGVASFDRATARRRMQELNTGPAR
ncbi:tetratricopeptide repeat protein [Oxalobacteraceae bacterium]|nr:tetratricopeptide repeat protein [Oxalobacteraceae bacterium]